LSVDLIRLGWTPSRQEEFDRYAAEGCVPARVAAQHRGAYVVYTAAGERAAELAGRLRHLALDGGALPAVGDWVAVHELPEGRATIQAVLTRASAFSRKATGEETLEQVVAANLDVAFLVAAFGNDVNVRRLERYLAAAWESGAEPVIVLNKSDLCEDLLGARAGVDAIAFGVPVHPVCCLTGEGLDALARYFAGHRTVALLGSSGVGKSSLLNRLLGHERQAVRDLRADGRGRHTTTHRELVPLPGGGLLLDTPGMRELGLWDASVGLGSTFDDIAALAAECRFSDCSHGDEPGCAVTAAITAGTLSADRLESHRKLLRELRHLELKQDARALAEERRERRRFARSMRKASY
jgi:ribosome biogenesis GTPase / thiamine phosphate phosphatase